ncbi:MAG TPA: hypothetical protein VJ476_04225 [Rhizomicrobium sp.]|nr:hypothetical protein [Rhizomicrobium sp.]
MRAAGIVVACLFAVAASAADLPALPDGWARAADGTYSHTGSGTNCLSTYGDLTFVRLDGPAAPGTLGVCVYAAGDTKAGQIRIRKFVDGAGDTPLAVQNDRSLMGLTPMAGAPAGSRMVAADRVGPGPAINGAPSRQTVITTLRNGLLVDCIVQDAHMNGMQNGLDPLLKACFSGP